MIISGSKTLDFAPQALAEVTPIANATGWFYGRPGEFVGDHFAAYGQLYRSQPWLSTVIDKIANAAARLTFQAWARDGKDASVDTSSAFAQLVARPCPLMSRFAFWRWTVSTYELYGEAYWLKIYAADKKTVTGFYPMHPTRTVVKRDPSNGMLTYIFTIGVASAGLLEVPEDDVVPFRRYNPEDLMRGLSRVESLRSTLADEDASRRANTSTWNRGARPQLMLGTDSKVSEGALKRLQAQITAQHAGPDRAGGSLLLEEGMKPFPIQVNAEQMQYVAARQLNREEVCAVYDVPPPIVHILDHATFSNIVEQFRSFYRETMAPRLEDIEDVIAHHVIWPNFDQTGTVSGRFALDEVLRGDFETRSTAVSQLIENGVMMPAEARHLFDLDDAGPISHRLYANAAIQELGMPAERVTLRATPPETPAQTALVSQTTDDAEQVAADQEQDTQRPAKSARRRRRTYVGGSGQ